MQEETVTAPRSQVVSKFISSFGDRGNFLSKPPFCDVWVCVSACPQQSNAQRLCVVPFWTALNFPKRFVSGCREKAEWGQELMFVEWMVTFLFFYFFFWETTNIERTFLRKKGTVLVGGAWGGGGVRGRGCAFFLFLWSTFLHLGLQCAVRVMNGGSHFAAEKLNK